VRREFGLPVAASGAEEAMPLAIMRTIPIRDFRKTDVFSGEVRVIAGSRTRRGARWQRGQASCNSPELAEPEAASFVDADGSATSTKAHAANLETGAGLAKPEAEVAERAPKEKKQKQRVNPADKAKAEAREEKKKQEEKKAKGSGGKSGGDGNGGSGKGGGKGDDDDEIPSVWEERACLNGGRHLPDSLPDFVDKVNERISVVRVVELLLRSPDDKAARGLAEKLLEAKYGKAARGELANFFGVNSASHLNSQAEHE
jgi:hypothetical protein